MRWIIYIIFQLLIVGCQRGDHQVILLKNLSAKDIYFLISKNKILTNKDDIARIRPIVARKLQETNSNSVNNQVEHSRKQSLFRFLIEKDSIEVILTSEAAGIYVNAITIKSIIKDRFDGQINIFIINENDLIKHSDQEIIDKKLYKYFKTLTLEDIVADTLTLEYLEE